MSCISRRIVAGGSLALALALLLGACSKTPEPAAVAAPMTLPAPAETPLPVVAGTASAADPGARVAAESAPRAEAGIAWRHASSDADVDAAFSVAKAESKPLFLYWGATWCPPCNQVKATLFNRQDFIERSRAFVPVYIDGDSPGAQKLGARFHVSGYPTMLLFAADGTETTRVPGEVDPARYVEVVTLGMNARRPVRSVLADARSGGAGLGAGDWRLLAFYAWDADEQQIVKKAEVPALLKQLAAACPPEDAEVATRLWLKALAATDSRNTAPAEPASAARLVRLLADPAAARAQFDVLGNYPVELTRAVSARGTPARARVVAAFERALVAFEADPTLSRADRVGALITRVDLAKIDLPEPAKPTAGRIAAPRIKLAPALLADVRDRVARADREIADGYERQAVITAAAYLLADAGLLDESDALLEANLPKSHSPYYLMTELAGNAARRGDKSAALRWHREAYDRSVGPATRLQWGARYVAALIELAPRDEAQIGHAAEALLGEIGAQPDVFYERSAASLRRVSTRLRAWNQDGTHAAVVRDFDARLGAICAALDGADAQRATCDALLKPVPPRKRS